MFDVLVAIRVWRIRPASRNDRTNQRWLHSRRRGRFSHSWNGTRNRPVIPAWYMKFTLGHRGSLDRVGGLPTHLPPAFPRSADGERPLMFIGQFHCHPDRLVLGDTFLLQVYQDVPHGLPDPVVIRVPRDAPRNTQQLGTPAPGVLPHDIEWEYREDPDESDEHNLELAASKLWGRCYFGDLAPGERLLLFLDEQPAGFNFGGDELMLAITEVNEIVWVGA